MSFIVDVSGGLGNQLFQLAFAINLSKANKRKVFICDANFVRTSIHDGFKLTPFIEEAQINNFDIALEKTDSALKTLLFRIRNKFPGLFLYSKEIESQPYKFQKYISADSRVIYFGYWQSEKYFSTFAREVASAYKSALKNSFTRSLNEVNYEKIKSDSEIVGVHFRRGDYLSTQYINAYGILSLSYYSEAVNLIGARLNKKLHLFIFSDDINWVRENFQPTYPATFVSEIYKDSLAEMYLMTLCDHFVTANSSFSWWGAYLCGNNEKKTVVTPKNWFLNTKTPDLIPNNWIKI